MNVFSSYGELSWNKVAMGSAQLVVSLAKGIIDTIQTVVFLVLRKVHLRSLDAPNSRGTELLQKAVKDPSQTFPLTPAILILSGADVNVKDEDENTPLHTAIIHADMQVIQDLIEAGADVDAQNKNGSTPLHLAAEHESNRVIDLLVEKKAKVNSPNKDGKTALHLALSKNHLKTVQALINGEADVHVADEEGYTPLHHVAFKPDVEKGVEFAKVLLQGGLTEMNPRSKNDQSTPLHIAALNNTEEMAKWLIEQDADIDPLDKEGYTPCIRAIELKNQKVKDVLIEKGARLDIRDEEGRNILLYGRIWNQNEEDSIALIEGYDDLDAVDSLGDNAISAAARAKQTEILIDLVAAGANIHAPIPINGAGERQPLLCAAVDSALFSHPQVQRVHTNHVIVATLIALEVDINDANEKGETALHLAMNFTNRKDSKIPDLLVANGANYNIKCCEGGDGNSPLEGQTPLEMADAEMNQRLESLAKDENSPMRFKGKNRLERIGELENYLRTIENTPETVFKRIRALKATLEEVSSSHFTTFSKKEIWESYKRHLTVASESP